MLSFIAHDVKMPGTDDVTPILFIGLSAENAIELVFRKAVSFDLLLDLPSKTPTKVSLGIVVDGRGCAVDNPAIETCFFVTEDHLLRAAVDPIYLGMWLDRAVILYVGQKDKDLLDWARATFHSDGTSVLDLRRDKSVTIDGVSLN